jgi:hypothetical protein
MGGDTQSKQFIDLRGGEWGGGPCHYSHWGSEGTQSATDAPVLESKIKIQ